MSNLSGPGGGELALSVPEKSLACHVLMLDILLEQLEIQEEPSNGGLHGAPLAQHCLTLLKDMLHVRQSMLHNCPSADCYMCSLLTSWYQLAQELIAFFSPLHAAVVAESQEDLDTCVEMAAAQSVAQPQPSPVDKTGGKFDEKLASALGQSPAQTDSKGQINLATVETVTELDVAPILPFERVLKGIDRRASCPAA